MFLIRKNILFLFVATLALALTGCGGDDDNPYGLEDDETVKASKTWTWTCPASETAGQVCKARYVVNTSESHTFADTVAYGTTFTATQAAATGDTAEAGVKYYLHVQHAYFATEAATDPVEGTASEVSTVYALLKHGA